MTARPSLPAGREHALLHELRRKLFHLLTLVYLAAYLRLGPSSTAFWLAAWTALVFAVETARLRLPAFNALVIAPFRAIVRPHEERRYSGLFYTSVGALATIVLFGPHRLAVSAGLVTLALGDAAAAVVGRAFGRRRWPNSDKSVEGTAAFVAACFGGTVFVGVPWPAALAASAAAAAVETSPAPFDDNLWIPVTASAVVWLMV